MTLPPTRRVVVGVDRSPESLDAARLAAMEAARRGYRLRIVLAYAPGPGARTEQPPVRPWKPYDDGRLALDETVAALRRDNPGLDMTTAEVPGDLVAALLAESDKAALVVLSGLRSDGHGGLFGRSAATRVATRAHCPVLVARGTCALSSRHGGVPGRPVVVGLDGTAASWPAAEFAFAEASLLRVPVHAVHVWCSLRENVLAGVGARAQRWRPDVDRAGDARRSPPDIDPVCAVDEALGELPVRYPDVPVVREPVFGVDAGPVLLAASERAQLVVVGSHGRGPVASAFLGSVSRGLIHHAGCPVAVVRGP